VNLNFPPSTDTVNNKEFHRASDGMLTSGLLRLQQRTIVVGKVSLKLYF
jgi:hypothetical protein